MAANAQYQPAPKSEMQQDVDHWVGRLNGATANSSSITQPQGSAPWSSGFFDCFNPIDTCLITCCCPCVTFGKTHHRLHKSGTLQGYSPVNASCIGWYFTSCFGLHCVGNLLQKNDIANRAEPKLATDFPKDFLKAWCLACCDLIQQDKEAERLMAGQSIVMQQPSKQAEAGMTYAPPQEPVMAAQEPVHETAQPTTV